MEANIPSKTADQRAKHRQLTAVRHFGMSARPNRNNSDSPMRAGKTQRDKESGAWNNRNKNAATRAEKNRSGKTKGKR